MTGLAVVMVIAIHLSCFAFYLAGQGDWAKVAGAVVMGLGAGLCWWVVWLLGMDAGRWFDEAERLEFFADAEADLPKGDGSGGGIRGEGRRVARVSPTLERRLQRRPPERFRWLPRG